MNTMTTANLLTSCLVANFYLVFTRLSDTAQITCSTHREPCDIINYQDNSPTDRALTNPIWTIPSLRFPLWEAFTLLFY